MVQIIGFLLPMWENWLWALAQDSLKCWEHLGSKLADGSSLSLKSINKQKFLKRELFIVMVFTYSLYYSELQEEAPFGKRLPSFTSTQDSGWCQNNLNLCSMRECWPLYYLLMISSVNSHLHITAWRVSSAWALTPFGSADLNTLLGAVSLDLSNFQSWK